MTILRATLLGESSRTGVHSEPVSTSSSGDLVIEHEFGEARPQPLPNTSSIQSLIAEYEQDAEMAPVLAEARKDLGNALYRDSGAGVSLSGLRLLAGLSQAQLAERAGTSQPHVARIEAGQNDPTTDSIARIAAALGVDEQVAFAAIRVHRTRGLRRQQ